MKFVENRHDHGIGFLTLQRPEKRNALNPEMVQEITKSLRDFERDPGVRVVILSGEGKAFCAGADLEYLRRIREFNYDQNLEDSRELKEMFYSAFRFSKPLIAQVQGPALGGGAGLASVCDFVFGCSKTKIGYPEVGIGFIPAIVAPLLLQRVTPAKAKMLLISGEVLGPSGALESGLLDKVVEDDQLDNEVLSFARNLMHDNSGLSMIETKKLISETNGVSFEEALELGCRKNAEFRLTDDFINGLDHFLSKKPIEWYKSEEDST